MTNPQRAAYRYVLSVPFSMLAASDVGGHRKLIRDGKTGMQFKIGSATSPAETIMNLLAARDSWAEPRAAGRRYVETERNWRNSVGRYADIYDGIIPRSVA
jgi:glycogen synthase